MTTTKFNPATRRRCGMLFVLLVAIAIISGDSCAFAQGYGSTETNRAMLNDVVPYQVRDVTVDQKLGERIPTNLPLTDSTGRQIKTGYLIDGDKPTIITLNYSSCPMLCSVQLNQLTQSLAQMDLKIDEDFHLLTVSIDPKETTEQIRQTKEKYLEQLARSQPGADQGWAFCTAKQPIITQLADTLGFRYRYDRSNGEYYHPAMLAFVSPEGVITRYSLGMEFPPDQMRKALVESGEGTVGSVVDQAILWCFSFDPTSNSYVPQAWKIMRLGGAATVCIVLACLTPYWFGRKRSPGGADDESSDADTAMDSLSSSEAPENTDQI